MPYTCEHCPYGEILTKASSHIEALQTGIAEAESVRDDMNGYVANLILSKPNPELSAEEVAERRGNIMDSQARISRVMQNFTGIFETVVQVLDDEHCDVTDKSQAASTCPKKTAVITAATIANEVM